jgi:hypothetical protein
MDYPDIPLKKQVQPAPSEDLHKETSNSGICSTIVLFARKNFHT